MPSLTVENYLKAIYQLSDEGIGRVSPGVLARDLGVTPGTVTTMVKQMAGKGYLDYISRRGVELTDEGRLLARSVLRRHRITESFLVDILGMQDHEVHEEAEVLEHVLSERGLDCMDRLLGHPTHDPHGTPIPPA